MSGHHLPRIVTNGLIFCLDAGNVKSYPSSGTTWADLSGSIYNGALVGGPTFSDNKIIFANNSQYANCGGAAAPIRGAQKFTMEAVFSKSLEPHNSLFGAYNASTGQGWFFQWLNSTFYFGINSGYNHISLPHISGIYHIVGVYDGTESLDANKGKIYVNSIRQNVTVAATWPTSVPVAEINFYISNLENYSYVTHSLTNYVTRIYNRALTQTEINQNYEATRTRFGL